MIQAISNYFLSGYRNSPYFEKRKVTYLFYILMSALFFMTLTTVSQIYLGMGRLYLTGNLIAMAGLSMSLVCFKLKKINAAGHLMACSIMVTIAIESILVDCFSTDPAIRYRLYINFTSFLGVYFIILSFFREKKYVLLYALAFEILLFAHACVIYNQINYVPKMGMYTLEHFLSLSIGMVLIAAICTWLLSYMDALLQQNIEFAERFKSQNEQLEKMVSERTNALQNSNKNLREFAHIVSHDLKEPLRTISGFVTLIQKELTKQGLKDGEIEEYINYVTAGTRQMERLISDILTYSKLNVTDTHFETVSVQEIMGQVRSNLAKSIYESEAEIYVTDTLPVRGERVMLNQLFENLISNAIKYRSTEQTPKITIGCHRELDMVRYFVKDNGIGISEKYFETIFKAFRRLHSKMEYEGTGVGLAICKKIIDIHGGDIWVESNEGEGSTFWFILPGAHTDVPAIQPVVHAD
jgi:signal transduction histidine kinase